MAEEEMMIDEGVDEGAGRRGIDWNRIERTLKLEHEAERNANRRRGQQVFNELISKGTPYADALKEAGNAGLFYDNIEGEQQAYQRMEALKSKAVPNRRAIYIPGKGIYEPDENSGKYTNTVQIEAPPKPAPIVATRKDPVSGANIRMNQDQLTEQSLLTPAREMTSGQDASTVNPAAISELTGRMKALRLSRENPIPQIPSGTNTPTLEKVIVTKDGKKFRLPKSQLDEALKSGYEVFQ